jgi:transposase
MANKTKTMLQIRRMLQLLDAGKSKREIARQISVSRNTIDYYAKRFRGSKKSLSELLAVTDQELSGIVYKESSSTRKDNRYERLAPRLNDFVKELSRRGVTRLLLWKEYRSEDVDGYSYQQFCEHLNTCIQVHSAVMHLDHKPAERAEIDFAGGKMSYVDKQSGELIECPVLLGVLPYSGFTYAEALVGMELGYLIPALGRCMEYFGGVPECVLSDNMRQMVKKSNRYEPSFTDLAQQWSVHYNTSLLATRIAKPKDKPTVENAVNLAYQRIYAPLRNDTFGSLSELNYHIKQCLESHNNTLFQKKDFSRKERFLLEEKGLLKPLPSERFEVKYSVTAKVQRNYHVTLGQDWHHYSVPFQYIGKQVTIVYDSEHVEIFLYTERIASHSRNYRKHGYSTLDFHMPPHHLHYREARGWNQEYFLKKADSVGVHFKQAITHVLDGRRFTEQTYNACLGLLRLESKYGKERLEKASQIALKAGMVSYTTISTILINNRDKQIPEIDSTHIPQHENIRGEQTYLDF